MKVRKFVAGLAAVSMLAAVSAQAVSAADEVTISAEKVTAAAGETFTMNVSLSGVPAAGISVCEFAITYDADIVTVTGVTAGAIANTGADGVEDFEGVTAFEADYSTAGVINTTYTTGLDDTAYWITTDGVFLTITGTVNANAAEGAVSAFEIGAINRETTEGSGVTNAEISIGNIGADYTVTQYTAAVDNGSVTVTSGEQPVDVKYGDVNVDGEVDVLDIIVLNKYLLGGGSLSEQGAVNADVDKDNDPSANDSLNIMKYIVKLIDALPVA